ncbi:MAG: hypothetical protein QM767_19845 [Anaeromyxobacter sp.]
MPGKAPQLKPQDVLVLINLALRRDAAWSYPQVAAALGLSVSEVHAAVQRGLLSRLAVASGPKGIGVQVQNLLEFLIHGVKYAFPVVRGQLTRGHPTGYAAPVLRNLIAHGDGSVPVWPDPEGTARGESFSPLYSSQATIRAILADAPMYDAAALVDAIRGGSARERQVAGDLLQRMLSRSKR